MAGGLGNITKCGGVHAGGDRCGYDLLLEGGALRHGESRPVVAGLDRIRVAVGPLVVPGVIKLSKEPRLGGRIIAQVRFPVGAIQIEAKHGHVFVGAEEVGDCANRWKGATLDEAQLPVVVPCQG